MLTIDQFKKLYPQSHNPEVWLNAINTVLPKYEINTANRIAAFIAQCGHESAGWRYFVENLNYSEAGLNAIFGRYFKSPGVNAREYARKPEKIANLVYANRMGNGPENSGDGWKYRGRGPIQLTGKNNYTAFSKAMGVDAVNNPDLVGNNPERACLAAVWFWNTNKLNAFADSMDLKGMTKKINGGYLGLDDRISHFRDAMNMLGKKVGSIPAVQQDQPDTTDVSNCGVLRMGSKGEGVKILQKYLKVEVDGFFGPVTEKALKQWQSKNGIEDDGIAGPVTFDKLLGSK